MSAIDDDIEISFGVIGCLLSRVGHDRQLAGCQQSQEGDAASFLRNAVCWRAPTGNEAQSLSDIEGKPSPAGLAQLVEHLTCNHVVIGSIPIPALNSAKQCCALGL